MRSRETRAGRRLALKSAIIFCMTQTPALTPSPPAIHGWHAHVYFNADTLAQARALCEAAAARIPLKMCREHEQPVGPHPARRCQPACKAALFAEVGPGLTLSRAGLEIFNHPITGKDLVAHRDRALWMGAV